MMISTPLLTRKDNVLLTGNKEVKTLFKSLQKQQHTMKKWITHLIERVYVIEDLIAEHLRRNKSHDVCMHIGCNSKPSTDKAYCRKHLHGKGNRFKNL